MITIFPIYIIKIFKNINIIITILHYLMPNPPRGKILTPRAYKDNDLSMAMIHPGTYFR